MWSRPDQIRAHITSKHAENVPARAPKSLRGRRIVEFVDADADADARYPIKTMIISTGCDDFYFVG
jgi:hypothetical protein